MLYEIAGLGTANPIEVGATLQTLKEAVEAQSDDDPFWLILPGLETPTKTYQDIVAWADSQKVYYEVVTDELTEEEARKHYPEAEAVWTAKHMYNRAFQLLTGRVMPGEDKALLVLDDEENEDIDLLLLINKCLDTDIPVYSLGGQMAPVILEDDPEPTAAEDHTAALEAEEQELTPAQKALEHTQLGERMDAAAAKAAENAAARVEHDENPTQGPAPAYTPSEIDDTPLTREDLKDFSAAVLRDMVKQRDLVARDMRSKESLIDALTGTTAPPKPQMPEPEPILAENAPSVADEAEEILRAAAAEATAKIADDHPTTAWKDHEPTDEADAGRETEQHRLDKVAKEMTNASVKELGDKATAMLDDIEHRFTNHPPVATGAAEKLDAVTAIMIDMSAKLALLVPPGREHSLMLTQLEQASMWAKAGIARNQ